MNEKAIPEGLEVFIRKMIKQLAFCGQGMGKKLARQIIEAALKDGCVNTIFSPKTLEQFGANNDLECRSVKNIDPACIS